jgi:hypothetical protein
MIKLLLLIFSIIIVTLPKNTKYNRYIINEKTTSTKIKQKISFMQKIILLYDPDIIFYDPNITF